MSEQLPSEDVVQQEEVSPLHIAPVPVTIEGPVRTQEYPSVIASMRSINLGSSAETILPANPRRRRAVVLSFDQPVYLGRDISEVNAGGTFLLPERVPLEIKHTRAVAAGVAQASATSILSIMVEEWTE
jgi:hypothetical protein